MKKPTAENKKRLRELDTKLKVLREKLAQAKKLEGKDDYIKVALVKNQARFERIKKRDEKDTVLGNFYMEVALTAKQAAVFVPISIASGKKTAGFMYQIEGTAEAAVATANVRVRGEGVSLVTLGTLLFAKIPAGTVAKFQIRATIRGKIGKEYKLVFTRLNYKLSLTETRYQRYVKELHSRKVKLA